ncbi:MAG TPA: UdgX family uracil-DNA binding protein [Vicinamibacterales bacterium]|nr:UdgX family uracil-DNA binding protein [Vicinamibacterales bacterium]
MRLVRIRPSFEDWRDAARALLRAGVPPDQVQWAEADDAEREAPAAPAAGPSVAVPRAFLELAERVAAHRDPDRWALLYRLLWRLVHEDRRLLGELADPDVARARQLERTLAVRPPVDLFGGAAPPSAAALLPETRTLAALREAAARCTACPLYERATQTVFGEGPETARAMFIGEQPGDQEDLQGRPFVGPAGEVLTRALADAGLDRRDVYITNVVKHFKWEPRGKRRLHLTPRQPEIDACRPWLEAEIALIRPAVIVCLGSTAAQALMGAQFRIMRDRGRLFASRWAPALMATIHPSAVLRTEDPAAEARAYAGLVDDLRKVAERLRELRTPAGTP